MNIFMHLGKGNFVNPETINGVGIELVQTDEYDPESDSMICRECVAVYLNSGQTIYLEDNLEIGKGESYVKSVMSIINSSWKH